MKIRFNRADKSITFLDGTDTINANDVMYQYLEVEVVPALSTSESLWVVYKNVEYGEYSNEILIADSGAEAKAAIPEEVIVAGEWTLQLLVRKYLTSDPARYMQEGSAVEPFTVSDGLRTTTGGNVNNGTIAALYQTAKEVLGTRETLQESIDGLTEAVASNTGKAAEMEELKTQVAGMDIAMTRFAENTLPQMENRIETVEKGLLTAESDIKGLRRDIQNESHFRGYVPSVADFETMPGDVNDYAYSSEDGFIWVHNGTAWEKTEKEIPGGAVPLGDNSPLVDGEASPGESTNAAREDHRHPTDTTRASAQELTALSDKVNRLHSAATPTVLTVEVAENTTVSFTAQQIGATFIDWGDGAVTTEFNDLPTHTYAKAGIYDIKIFDATVLAGAGLTSILGYAFTTLKRVVVGDSVALIGSYAFYHSPNLKYVTISDSVVSIGSAAFYECPNLAKVVIGSGVESIESNAFYYPPAVLQLNAEIPPLITTSTFGQADDTLILVPHGSVEQYRSAEHWTSLAAQITANAWLSDLDGFVKFTDDATGDKAGLVRVPRSFNTCYGIIVNSANKNLTVRRATNDIISKRTPSDYIDMGQIAADRTFPICPANLDYAAMSALADCKDTTLWTDDTTDENGEVVKGTKTKARELIGALQKIMTGTQTAYLVQANGELIPWSYNASGNALIRRLGNGSAQVKMADAPTDLDIANVGFVVAKYTPASTDKNKTYLYCTKTDSEGKATHEVVGVSAGQDSGKVVMRDSVGLFRINNILAQAAYPNTDMKTTNLAVNGACMAQYVESQLNELRKELGLSVE